MPFEEDAAVEIAKYKKEMQEYNEKYINQFKKADDISRLFVEKLRAYEEHLPPACDPFEPLPNQNMEIYESMAD